MYCCTTFVEATFFIRIKLLSTAYNILRHVLTRMNKVIKRSRLFPLGKCCMLYYEKSSSFDWDLTRPTHCNAPPPPPPYSQNPSNSPCSIFNQITLFTPFTLPTLFNLFALFTILSHCTHSLILLFTQLFSYLTPLIPLTLLT